MACSETKQLKACQQDSELGNIQSTSQESHNTIMDCKILALVYFLDTFHCNTVTIVELGCVFGNSLSSGPSSDEGNYIFV